MDGKTLSHASMKTQCNFGTVSRVKLANESPCLSVILKFRGGKVLYAKDQRVYFSVSRNLCRKDLKFLNSPKIIMGSRGKPINYFPQNEMKPIRRKRVQ